MEKYKIKSQIQFSDCCAAQNRCSTSFADLSFSHIETPLKIQRNHFESSHGKSAADDIATILKHADTRVYQEEQSY